MAEKIEIPLNPVGREEIHKLESILLFATLFRPEVLSVIKDPTERLTWVDSLAVAAGALAREKAKMTVSQIAEELGRGEQTIRKHLKGETKAGQVVRETYELIKKGELDKILQTVEKMAEGELEKMVAYEEFEKVETENKKLKEENEKLKEENEKLKKEISEIRSSLERLSREKAELEDRIRELEKELEETKEKKNRYLELYTKLSNQLGDLKRQIDELLSS